MRFMHLADLHLGKSVNAYPMIEDQRYALKEILKLLEREKVKTVLISGDIYQNSVPATDAINLFSDFLLELKKMDCQVLIISGNHDSPDRLAYANRLLKDSKIYISDSYKGEIEKVTLEDEYGDINFYLFPYVKPAHVNPYFEETIKTYEEAVSKALSTIDLDNNQRNVILSHQFILNAQLSDSEEIFAGDLEAVPAKLYEDFDYVALGHIHKKQEFMGGKIRYPGALLKYSASEANYDKTITIVELRQKGYLNVEEYRIDYLRDMRIIRGYYKDIIQASKTDKARDDYIHIELLDEEDIFEGLSNLRQIYPNIMTYRYKENHLGENDLESLIEKSDNKSPLELFENFYMERLGKELSPEKRKIIEESIEGIWG